MKDDKRTKAQLIEELATLRRRLADVERAQAKSRRAGHFRVLREVGSRITSILAVDDLLKEIVSLLKETFGYSLITLGLIEGDQIVFKAGVKTNWNEPQFRPPPLKMGERGITAWVAAAGEPLLVPDVSQEPRYVLVPGASETRSELAVPLKTKTGVIGVLNVESDQLNAFDESDLTVLQSLAYQAAIAIENARLYEDIKRRLAQLTALQETTRAVASTLELDKLLSLITQQAATLLQADAGIINLVDWGKKQEKVVATTGWTASVVGHASPLENGLSGWVALHNQPVISNQLQSDNRADQRMLSQLAAEVGHQVRSAAIAPLAIKGQVMGTLEALDKQGGKGKFEQADLDLLVAFANQAAVSIENGRLFAQVEQRMRELEALYHVEAELNRAEEELHRYLRLDRVLQALVDQAVELLRAKKSSLMIWDAKREKLVVGAARGFKPETLPRMSFSRGEGNVGLVAASGEPMVVEDTHADPRVNRSITDPEGIRSFIHFPIKIGGRVFGVFNVNYSEPRTFSEDEMQLCLALAQRAAVAIENARLFHAEQRRAEQFRAISEVGHRITSIMGVDELLQQIVLLVKETLGYHHAAIGLIEGDELVVKAGAGAHWDSPHFQPSRLKIGKKGITAWVAATGEPLLVPDVSQEPRYLPLPDSPQIRSELAVPLKTKNGVIGVLDAQSDQLSSFDETDLVVLQSLAHQAAIAIENASLYEQSQQVAVVEERNRLARELHDSVTQSLYGVTLYAEAASRLLASGNSTVAADHLSQLRATAQEALQEMRLLIFELRPPVLEREGLVAALQARLDAVEGRAGLETEFKVEGEPNLSPEMEEGLYRVAREALNNALKHAQAQKVSLRLRYGQRTVLLEIADDGIGFDPVSAREKGRLGLPGMEERVKQLGGNLTIKTRPGKGTRVRVEVHP